MLALVGFCTVPILFSWVHKLVTSAIDRGAAAEKRPPNRCEQSVFTLYLLVGLKLL